MIDKDPSGTTTAGHANAVPSAITGGGLEAFVGRQPIFDRQKQVYGYELLYRSSRENRYTATDGDQATSQTINNSMNIVGLQELVGNRKAFINITRQLLLNEFFTVLPKQTAVVELLESIEPDSQVVAACRNLKDAGFMLALDDFVFQPGHEPLLDLADFLKIDFLNTKKEDRRKLVDRFGGRRARLLAEKVEGQEDFEHALAAGYSYFQGYFFCKPQILVRRDVAPFKRNYLRFLHQVNQPNLDYTELERVIKEEVSLSYKLLRYLNSAAFGLRQKVSSIREALALLGEKPLRKWASLIAMAGMGKDKPAELAVTCLVRARFCESVGPILGLAEWELDLFLMGLLSALDALVDQPMTELLAQTPVGPEVKGALVGGQSPLSKVYALLLACERGNWERVATLCQEFGVPDGRVVETYRQSLLWADRIFSIA